MGVVAYAGDLKGWVNAELAKLSEQWKITAIKVEISDKKEEEYKRRHRQ
jgi:hypothetical protein